MEASILSKVVLPIALFIVMLGMGLSLTPKDFKYVSKSPKSLSIGLVCQLILLPIVGFFLAHIFQLSPILSVGLLILCLCPGGVTSNMFCYLAKGNVALSITLTAVVSLVTPFTIPIVADMGMNYFLSSSQAIELPLVKTIVTLLVITVLPVAIGMFIRTKNPSFANKLDSPVKILSMVFLLLIVAGIVKQNWEELPNIFAKAGSVALILNGGMMLVSYMIPKLLGVDQKDAISIGVEAGIQNGTTSLFITSTLLDDPVMSIPAASYSLIMFVTGSLYAFYWQKRAKVQA